MYIYVTYDLYFALWFLFTFYVIKTLQKLKNKILFKLIHADYRHFEEKTKKREK